MCDSYLFGLITFNIFFRLHNIFLCMKSRGKEEEENEESLEDGLVVYNGVKWTMIHHPQTINNQMKSTNQHYKNKINK